MSDTKHTPGPWISSEWRRDAHGEYKEVGAFGGNVWIADVRTPVEPGNGSANARLIAAAPDLLAACERAISFIENTEGEHCVTLETGDILRAAIAKAKPSQKEMEN